MPLLDGQLVNAGCLVSVSIHVSSGRLQALTQAGQLPPVGFSGIGLVDTGASHSVIDKSIVQFLGLQPTGVVPILTPSTGPNPQQCYEYDVSVWFLQGPTLVQSQPSLHPVQLTLPVTEADFSAHGFNVLIGRDILAFGVLIYNGLTCRFT